MYEYHEPIATGKTPDNGTALNWKKLKCNKAFIPSDVNAKCKNDKNTIKLYLSISVTYLLHITTPTTDNILPIMAIITRKLNMTQIVILYNLCSYLNYVCCQNVSFAFLNIGKIRFGK